MINQSLEILATRFSEIQEKRIRIGYDDDDQDAAAAVVCHNFWKEAPEDVLSEILIRLRGCGLAVRSSIVCHLWHSLILHNPRFIPRFTSQHQRHRDRYPPLFPYTIIFCNAELHVWPPREAQHCQPICQIFSDEWMFLHGKLSTNYLEFLPSQMVIRASCNDLLLVSKGGFMSKEHCICNPVTKEFVKLPVTPKSPGYFDLLASGYALLCMPPGPTNNISRFKVVEVLPSDFPFRQEPDALVHFIVQVFCSESRKWERKVFHYSRLIDCTPSALDIVTCNGVFYWLEDQRSLNRIIHLDLLKEQCGAINIPSEYSEYRPARIGVVHKCDGEQELRLIQVDTKHSQAHIRLKVWRLSNNNDDSSWVLVHNSRLEWPNNLREKQHYFIVHPTNGDLLFTVSGKNVFEFNLINATYKKINELRDIVCMDMLKSFSMVLTHDYGTSSNLANMISNPSFV